VTDFPVDVACKDRATISRECRKALKILDDAWSAYDNGRGEDAVTAFGKVCEYAMLDSSSCLS